MEHFDSFFGFFNLVLGMIFILIGFKIYRPFKNDEKKEEERLKKFGLFYKLGGIGLLIWGLAKII